LMLGWSSTRLCSACRWGYCTAVISSDTTSGA
jgi:hypothetical protein